MQLGVIRYLASLAQLQGVRFLWRSFLRAPNGDMVLECAIAAGCAYTVKHNIKGFRYTEQLGVSAATPSWFLQTFKQNSP